MTYEITKIKAEIVVTTPISQEQINKLSQTTDEIAGIEKLMQTTLFWFKKQTQTKDQLFNDWEKCNLVVSQLHQVDMVALVNQSNQIEALVQNHTDWKQLFASLRQIKDQHIDPLEYNIQRASTDAKKYIDSIQNGRKEEYDNVIRRIHLNAKLIKDDAEIQQQKLHDFVSCNLEGDAQHLIPAQDFLYLNLEVTRYRNSIQTVQSVKNAVIDGVNKIDAGLKQKNKALGVTPEELHFLKSSLRTLDKQLSVEIPRIKESVDALEAYAAKGLKNKLQDDNKRSQN